MALTFGKINRAASFNPTTAFPLDARSYFESYDLAVAAALTAKEAGDTTTVHYYGETLCVVENGAAKLYIIQPEGKLEPVGSDVEVSVNENAFTFTDGKIDLLGFSDAVAGAQLVKTEDGKISWVKPDATTVEGLQTAVSTLETNVSNLTTLVNNKADSSTVYTKTEVDNSLTAITNTLDNKANAADVYSKSEVDGLVSPKANAADVYTKSEIDALVNPKANSSDVYTKTEADSAIAAAVAGAEHLKRQIVDQADIDIYLAGPSLAEKNVIYMVKTGASSDAYKEYMRFDAEDGTVSFEQIGDTSVDLSNYVTSDALNSKADNLAALIQANTNNIALKANQSDLEALSTSVGTNTNEIAALKEAMNSKAAKSDLENLQEIVNSKAAQSDLDNLGKTVSANGEKIALLETNKADKSDLESLQEVVNSKAAQSDLDALAKTVSDNSAAIATKANQSDLTALSGVVDNKVEKVYSEVDGEQVAWTLLSPTNAKKLEQLSIDEDGSVGISGTVAADKVEGLADWITSKRDTVPGLFSTTYQSKLDGIEEGAQINVIEAIKLAGADENLTIANKTVENPYATDSLAGIVKTSQEITLNSDNQLEVLSLNVDKLVQTGDLLLNCGGAAGHTTY